MPRPKKRKTNNHHQQQRTSNNGTSLSHEEIWDDSALLRSWNDALAEYEFYHSIHAKGEDVDEVLRRAEMEGTADLEGDEDEGEVHEVEVGSVKRVVVEQQQRRGDGVDLDSDAAVNGGGNTGAIEASEPDGSRSIVETMKPGVPKDGKSGVTATATTTADQTLENIKMAYYWAGYYSGLYDAQRQAQSQTANGG